jgi:AmmeMemoRadiSam system protein B
MREMMAAGRHYERDRTLLLSAINAHYEGPRGPGSLPLDRIEHDTCAMIAPTSPYPHCGDCMAWAYKTLAESRIADVYIIVANHAAPGSAITQEAFLTPLEIARVDQELARAIIAKGHVDEDDSAHVSDHQIEVQLPFLQHAYRREMERVKILPLLLGTDADIRTIALDLKEAVVELGRKAVLIIATNMTQYGPLFHHVPFVSDIQTRLYDLDKGAIDFIITQHPDEFVKFCADKLANIPGQTAIELLLHYLPPSHARLLQYYQSGDVLNMWKNSVGYAAITFEPVEKTPANVKDL